MTTQLAGTNLTAPSADGSFTTAITRGNFPALYDARTAIDKMRIVLARWNVRGQLPAHRPRRDAGLRYPPLS
jgi:hypothetical protein